MYASVTGSFAPRLRANLQGVERCVHPMRVPQGQLWLSGRDVRLSFYATSSSNNSFDCGTDAQQRLFAIRLTQHLQTATGCRGGQGQAT